MRYDIVPYIFAFKSLKPCTTLVFTVFVVFSVFEKICSLLLNTENFEDHLQSDFTDFSNSMISAE